jgi:hypothetical protein
MKLFERIKKRWAIINHLAAMQMRRWEEHGIDQDPNDAIWFFGCSNVVAVDLLIEESAPNRLSVLTNTKVINYGICGSGPMMVEWQLDRLLKKYKPKAIIIAWPGFLRWQTHNDQAFPLLWLPVSLKGGMTHYHNDHFGCKSLWPKEWNQYVKLATTGELEKLNYEVVNRVREKIKGITTVEFEYRPDCPFEKFTLPCFPYVDMALDNIHPGPQTQKIISEWVYNELQLLL